MHVVFVVTDRRSLSMCAQFIKQEVGEMPNGVVAPQSVCGLCNVDCARAYYCIHNGGIVVIVVWMCICE